MEYHCGTIELRPIIIISTLDQARRTRKKQKVNNESTITGVSTRFLGLLTILHFNTAARFLKKPSCLSKPRYVVAICSPFTTTMRAFLSLLLVLNVAVFAKRFGGGEVGNRAVVEAVNGREVQVFGEDVTEELTGNWEAKEMG